MATSGKGSGSATAIHAAADEHAETMESIIHYIKTSCGINDLQRIIHATVTAEKRSV